MPRKFYHFFNLPVFSYILLSILVFNCIYITPAFSEEFSRLKVFNLAKIDNGIQLNIEHSKPPYDMVVETRESPDLILIKLIGSRVAFKKYENVPIEIPVKEAGINRIIVEERTDFQKKPSKTVFVRIEMTQRFVHEVDSQWNGQFLSISIFPVGTVVKKVDSITGQKEMDPSVHLEEIRMIKEIQSERAKKRLDEFTSEKRIDLIAQESKVRVDDVRQQAKERMDLGAEIEQAYDKLKAESEISSLPVARQQIMESNLYKDLNMPTEIKPMIKRGRPETEVVNLQDCIAVALKNYLPVDIANEQEKLAKLRVREARRAFYPSLLGEWNEIDGNTVTEPYRGRNYGLQGEQPLFTGGKITAALRKEQLGVLIAKGNLDRITQDLMVNVSKAYFEYIMNKNTYDVVSRLEEIQKSLMAEIEKEFTVFSATPAELLTAQAAYNQAVHQTAYAKRQMSIAKLALEKEMFTENLNVDNIDARLARKTLDTTLAKCRELAFEHRPEIKVLENTVKASKFGEQVIRSEELPNVSIIGSYGRGGEAFSERDLRLAQEWSVMGRVRWFLGGNTVETSFKKDKVTPFQVTRTDTHVDSVTMNTKFSFWDNLAHFSQRKETQITRKQALKDLEEMKNKIRQETEDSYYSFKRFSAQLSMAINDIGFRRKQLEIVKTKRSMYEASGSEVMNSEAQLAQANGTLQEALAGMNISIVSLNRAIGLINYFQ